MNFKKLTLDDIKTIKPYLKHVETIACDYTLGVLFMWRDYYDLEWAIEDDILYTRLHDEDRTRYYNLPIGKDFDKGIDRIVSYTKENGQRTLLCTVPGPQLELLKEKGLNLKTTEQREHFDYIYDAKEFTTFAGRKYSAQRNHINRFIRENPNWSFSHYKEEDYPLIASFLKGYIRHNQKDYDSATAEDYMGLEVITNNDDYNMLSGVLKVDDKIVGFSFGEIFNNCLFVHVEKADRTYNGSYQMLVREFAKAYVSDDVKFINREDDMDDEGLRKSKLSYNPIVLLDKYIVEIL